MTLHNLVLSGNIQDLELYFREHGTNLINEHSNLFGLTPLHISVKSELKDKVKILIEYGADTNSINDSGATPLFEAALLENEDIINLLIENGANVNINDKHGMSALDHALMQNKFKSVLLLIRSGANIKNIIFSELLSSKMDYDIYKLCESASAIDYVIENPWYLTEDEIEKIDCNNDILISRIKNKIKLDNSLFNNAEIAVSNILADEFISASTRKKYTKLKIALSATIKLLSLRKISSLEIDAIFEHNEILLESISNLNFYEVSKLKEHLVNLKLELDKNKHHIILINSFISKIDEVQKQISTIEAIILKIAFSDKSILLVPFNILKNIIDNYSNEKGIIYGNNHQFNIYFKDWDKINHTIKFYDDNPDFKIPGSVIYKFISENKLKMLINSASYDIKNILMSSIKDFLQNKTKIYIDVKNKLKHYLLKHKEI